jgi:hypothetical protein
LYFQCRLTDSPRSSAKTSGNRQPFAMVGSVDAREDAPSRKARRSSWRRNDQMEDPTMFRLWGGLKPVALASSARPSKKEELLCRQSEHRRN